MATGTTETITGSGEPGERKKENLEDLIFGLFEKCIWTNSLSVPFGFKQTNRTERPYKKKRPVLVAENGPKAKKAYPKTSLDKSI